MEQETTIYPPIAGRAAAQQLLELPELATRIRETVRHWTGVPVSIAPLLDFVILWVSGELRGVRKPYDFVHLLTIFSVPRRQGLDEEGADGTV